MLATISPASIHLDETLATLRYACQARTIINRVKVNEDPHDKIIRELRAEVDRLQSLQQNFDREQKRQSIEPRTIVIETLTPSKVAVVDEKEVKALREELMETRQELAQAERSWLDRLREAEAVRKTEMQLLQKKGLALEFSVEQKQACLVNLAADPMLSGTLLYIIPPGRVRVGRMRGCASGQQPDIVLEGPLVAFDHCAIENEGKRLFIEPLAEDFETFVNGELIGGKTRLYDGDRLVIGGSHYFRVANWNCERRCTSSGNQQQQQPLVDFQWAHQEILVQQERRLREELEAEKHVALQQIRAHQRAAEEEYEDRLRRVEMEKHKIKCSKELLESEVAIFKRHQRATAEAEDGGRYKSSYQSTLLEDIQRMLERPTEESLHQIQLKVKEATQRCRDWAAPFEFRQTQKVDGLGIFHAVVTIIDRERSKVAEWPPARLDVWLEMVREEDFDRKRLFDCVETVWMDWEAVDMQLEESFCGDSSMNSSRIGLNLSAVKETLLRGRAASQSPLATVQQQQQNSPPVAKKMLTYGKLAASRGNILTPQNGQQRSADKRKQMERRAECIKIELKEVQQGTRRLKKLLLHEDTLQELQRKSLSTACSEIERQLAVIKAVLDRGGDGGKLHEEVVKTPKSVRFLLD